VVTAQTQSHKQLTPSQSQKQPLLGLTPHPNGYNSRNFVHVRIAPTLTKLPMKAPSSE